MSGESESLSDEGQGQKINVRRHTLTALVLSFILTVIYFYDVVFTDKIFADRDTLIVYMPLFKYWSERILSGEFPDWFPNDALGQPFAGTMLGMAFHPIKVLFLLMDVGNAMKWMTLLCFPIAFNGMFLLCRSLKLDWKACLIGGLFFTFNGYSISLTNNIPYLLSMASIPWCWWLTIRVYQTPAFSNIALAAFFYALELFTGETQTFVTCCVSGGILPFVLREWSGRRLKAFLIYAGIMAMACLMSSVQWVPALHAVSQGAPGGLSGDSESVFWSFHPFRFLDLLFDGFNGHSVEAEDWFSKEFYRYDLGNYWTRSVYFGIIGIIFCGISYKKDKKMFFVLAGCLFLIFLGALGKYLGLYELLKHIPLFKPFRYPEKTLAVAMVLLSMMAASGFSALVQNLISLTKIRFIFGITALILLFVLFSESVFLISDKIICYSSDVRKMPENIQEEVSGIFKVSLSVSIGIIVLMLISINKKAFFPVFLSCCFFQFTMSSSQVYNPAFPEIVSQPIPPISTMLQHTLPGDSPRYASLSRRIFADALLDAGLDSEIRRATLMFMLTPVYGALFGAESFTKMYLPAASKRMSELKFYPKDRVQSQFFFRLFSAQFWSVFAKDYADSDGMTDDILYENPKLGSLIVRMNHYLPRAYLSRPFWVKDSSESFNRIIEMSFDPYKYTLVEDSSEGFHHSKFSKDSDVSEIRNKDELGTATIVFRKPEHVAIDVDAHTDGSVLVLTDAYYSGWTAMIDGSPAEILPANHAVRGVMMPKGKHRLEFKYRTPGLIPAAIVSLGTMLAALAVSIILFIRRRRNQPAVLSAQGENV